MSKLTNSLSYDIYFIHMAVPTFINYYKYDKIEYYLIYVHYLYTKVRET